MTCKDCIHFTDEIINDKYHLCDAYKTIGGTDRQDAWAVSSTDGGCKLFVYNDGTYSNGTWHCPRCGAIVSNAGLCDECDKAVDSWESVSK